MATQAHLAFNNSELVRETDSRTSSCLGTTKVHKSPDTTTEQVTSHRYENQSVFETSLRTVTPVGSWIATKNASAWSCDTKYDTVPGYASTCEWLTMTKNKQRFMPYAVIVPM
jgi:hypothetical protein